MDIKDMKVERFTARNALAIRHQLRQLDRMDKHTFFNDLRNSRMLIASGTRNQATHETGSGRDKIERFEVMILLSEFLRRRDLNTPGRLYAELRYALFMGTNPERLGYFLRMNVSYQAELEDAYKALLAREAAEKERQELLQTASLSAAGKSVQPRKAGRL